MRRSLDRQIIARAFVAAVSFTLAGVGAYAQRAVARSSVNRGASVNRSANINRNANVNRDVNANRNVNVNQNVNRNVNVNRDVNVDRHYDGWGGCCYHPGATAAVATAAAVTTAAVVGSTVHSLPPSCEAVSVNGFTYQQCGSTWYQPQFAGSNVTYVVVNPPK
jgi:hypothetical protein